jgi:hypothetical protein
MSAQDEADAERGNALLARREADQWRIKYTLEVRKLMAELKSTKHTLRSYRAYVVVLTGSSSLPKPVKARKG